MIMFCVVECAARGNTPVQVPLHSVKTTLSLSLSPSLPSHTHTDTHTHTQLLLSFPFSFSNTSFPTISQAPIYILYTATRAPVSTIQWAAVEAKTATRTPTVPRPCVRAPTTLNGTGGSKTKSSESKPWYIPSALVTATTHVPPPPTQLAHQQQQELDTRARQQGGGYAPTGQQSYHQHQHQQLQQQSQQPGYGAPAPAPYTPPPQQPYQSTQPHYHQSPYQSPPPQQPAARSQWDSRPPAQAPPAPAGFPPPRRDVCRPRLRTHTRTHTQDASEDSLITPREQPEKVSEILTLQQFVRPPPHPTPPSPTPTPTDRAACPAQRLAFPLSPRPSAPHAHTNHRQASTSCTKCTPTWIGSSSKRSSTAVAAARYGRTTSTHKQARHTHTGGLPQCPAGAQ